MTESASRVVTVQVTEEDIKEGVRRDRFRCPVAIALSRHLRAGEAVVTSDFIDILTPTTSPGPRMQLPPSVEDFIEVFDDYGPEQARPFSFSFELPEWILRAEDQEQNPR